MNKKILLFIQLGTPKSPEPKDVGSYLKEFLMDPNVLSFPFLLRWILVYLFIVPRRKYKSSKAYKLIWRKKGSPLLLHSNQFIQGIKEELKNSWSVFFAMRYGSPSIFKALKKIKEEFEVQNKDLKKGESLKIYVQSLYPHHTLSTHESAHIEILDQALKLNLKKSHFQFLPEFYDQDFFILSLAQKIKKFLLKLKEEKNETLDHIVFSYHGLPKKHIRKLDPTKHCDFKSCCESLIHPRCYRAQCFQTTTLLCKNLNWSLKKSSTAFQSRLLFNWIKPYTLDTLHALKKKGVKKIALVTPSFVSDCLETLEEVEFQLREEFLSDKPSPSFFPFFSKKNKKNIKPVTRGVKEEKGIFHSLKNENNEEKKFYRIPCLNEDKNFIKSFAFYLNSLTHSKDLKKE